jgi:hypothetical protein
MGRGFWSPLYGGVLDGTHDEYGGSAGAVLICPRMPDYYSYSFPIARRVIGIIGRTVTGADG